MINFLQKYLTEVYFFNYSVSTRVKRHRDLDIFSAYVFREFLFVVFIYYTDKINIVNLRLKVITETNVSLLGFFFYHAVVL
jgi:hypothetical protein